MCLCYVTFNYQICPMCYKQSICMHFTVKYLIFLIICVWFRSRFFRKIIFVLYRRTFLDLIYEEGKMYIYNYKSEWLTKMSSNRDTANHLSFLLCQLFSMIPIRSFYTCEFLVTKFSWFNPRHSNINKVRHCF